MANHAGTLMQVTKKGFLDLPPGMRPKDPDHYDALIDGGET